MVCSFCGGVGHNIRYCKHNSISFALMKLRCNSWRSINKDDLFILFNWLSKLEVCILRLFVTRKYNVFPKTMSRVKLVAIIMHLELGRLVEEEDAFWSGMIPDDCPTTAFDCDDASEKAVIIVNINTYQPPVEDLQYKKNDDLVDILMLLIREYRTTTLENRRTKYRVRINYIEDKGEDKEDKREEDDKGEDGGVNEDVGECCICYDNLRSITVARLGCGHAFCCGCIEKHIRCTKQATVNCPMCRGEIKSVMSVCAGNASLISIL